MERKKQLRLLITMVDNRTNYARDISDLIFDTYGNQIKIFPQSIPFSVRAAEISAEGISIFEHMVILKRVKSARFTITRILVIQR